MAEWPAELELNQEPPMKTRSLIVTAIATLALTVSPAVYASPVSLNAVPVHAFLGKAKNVQLSFRNDSGAALELKAGDSVMKLEPGQTFKTKLPSGTRVVTANATPTLQAGALVTEVASYLDGATISIK
jgi:hypothetical protein